MKKRSLLYTAIIIFSLCAKITYTMKKISTETILFTQKELDGLPRKKLFPNEKLKIKNILNNYETTCQNTANNLLFFAQTDQIITKDSGEDNFSNIFNELTEQTKENDSRIEELKKLEEKQNHWKTQSDTLKNELEKLEKEKNNRINPNLLFATGGLTVAAVGTVLIAAGKRYFKKDGCNIQ